MYVTSTSRHPTAALGAATGFFLGNAVSYVIVNRARLLSLYRWCEAEGRLQHVQDFHPHCTVKYVLAIPISEPSTSKIVRHLLLLCSAKQEVSIVALDVEKADALQNGPFVERTLYCSSPDDCFYQFHPGDMDLCCCSQPNSFSTARWPPFVAFALTRGELYFFDVYAAIAGVGRHLKKTSLLQLLFPATVVAAIEQRSGAAAFTHCCLDCSEFDVRDAVFGLASPSYVTGATSRYPNNHIGSEETLGFFVLHADPHGRMHVSEYGVYFASSDDTTSGSISCTASHTATTPPMPSSIQGQPVQPSSCVRRVGVLQSNLDMTSSKLVVSPYGVFVVGNHLVTLIQIIRQRKVVCSREIPSRSSMMEVSVAIMLTVPQFLVVCFQDGAVLHAQATPDPRNTEQMALQLEFIPQGLPTIPHAAVSLPSNRFLVCSRLDSSYTIQLNPFCAEVVLSNCGPVLDMATEERGPRSSVIASTGLGRNGGISVVRSAVSFQEQAAISLSASPSRVLCADNLLVAVACKQNRFFHVSAVTTTIRELDPQQLSRSLRHPLLDLAHDRASGEIVAVSVSGVVWMQRRSSTFRLIKEQPTTERDGVLLLGAIDHGFVAVSGGRSVVVYHSHQHYATIGAEASHGIACLAFPSRTHIALGSWAAEICLYQLERSNCVRVGIVSLSSIPRSIASTTAPNSSAGDDVHFFVGSLDGYLEEISSSLATGAMAVNRRVWINNHPVEVSELEGRNAVLCFGAVPMVVLPGANSIDITGLSLAGVTAGASIGAVPGCFAFFSQQDSQLHIGQLDSLEKTTRCFLPLHDTVTALHRMPQWDGYIVAMRKIERDELAFLPSSFVESPWSFTSPTVGEVPLLENERCVFLETVNLGGSNGELVVDEYGLARNVEDSEENTVLLVGSSFTFPDEPRSRSSRIAWYKLRPTTPSRRLHHVAGIDVPGSLQCCAAVPHYKGRIALGINGCVSIYKWSSDDATFVAQERCRIGLTVTKLVPLYDSPMAASVLVAFDVRFSAIFLKVDALQGSISILCRDAQLRGVMDGLAQPEMSEVFLCDDGMNFVSLKAKPAEATSSAVDQQATARCRFETCAKCHLGELVTCLRVGSFAAVSARDTAAPTPSRLLPGIKGKQMVFGTVHGAFGVVTPVAVATYKLLSALERALEQVTTGFGGFEHRSFRDLLYPGQERGVSCKVLQNGTALMRTRLDRYQSINTVDGDFLEMYQTLSLRNRKQVARVASQLLINACASPNAEVEGITAGSSAGEVFVLPSGPLGSIESYEPTRVEAVNVFLQDEMLPKLPFEVRDLDELVFNLQRIH